MAKVKKKALPAAEDGVAVSLARFLDVYADACRLENVAPVEGVVTRFRDALKDHTEGTGRGAADFPIVVAEPLDPSGVRALMAAVLQHPHQQLGLWKADLRDEGAMALADLLPRAHRLRTLEILDCRVGPPGAAAIGTALAQNDALTSLTLDHNPLGDDGAAGLGAGLKWNSGIARLSLQYCGIGSQGGEALAKTILRAGSVKELQLKGNRLGPAGVIAFATALPRNVALATLGLADNGFGIDSEALEALRDGIEGNDSLTALDLSLNALVPAGSALLLEALAAKPRITALRLPERTDPAAFREALEAATSHARAAKGKAKPRAAKATVEDNPPPPASPAADTAAKEA
eukprot:TRINITY_DN17038_c0_g1_i1.p1 TRINITY_DN17038_c0_g1~~TRINITY_DN17038_c0_g1_i1.p1  ORF type:complete len:348 (+),score=107.52 TRINITY_DN17038_c0_g1_i1:46-1089(+)